jgi:hypothetical protein
MKKNDTNQLTLTAVAKSIAAAFNSLFFNDNSRESQRLKNYLA